MRKLTISIAILFTITIASSFVTNTDFFKDNFTYSIKKGDYCGHFNCGSHNREIKDGEYVFVGQPYSHSHWNGRGVLYFIFCTTIFGLQLANIIITYNKSES